MNVVQRPGETGAANPLKQLERYGQAPWLDFIQRSFVADGSLALLIERDGLRGVTSNPAIFQKAMGEGTDYDEGFQALAHAGDTDPIGLYETLAIQDIQAACDVLRPVYDATGQRDGFVSLEVSPYLALRTDDTVAEARRLWEGVGRANLMVKVPGTTEGAPAIRQLIADGININVTLLFSQASYQAVAEAFMAGLEERAAAGKPVAGIASVASFFVSRIDAKIDKAIDKRVEGGEMDLARLRGKVAIANAKMAYQLYLGMIASPRWRKLADAGAQPQRLLWASTGVKDKAYSDVLYVEELIGRDTVNTIPPATMDAFRDHGQPRDSLAEGVDEARRVLEDTERAGLKLDEVTRTLVVEGVASFAESADTLLGAVAAKRAAMLGDRLCRVSAGNLPGPLAADVKAAMETWRKDGLVRRLWAGDAALWTGADEARWLGWLGAVDAGYLAIPQLQALQDAVRAESFRHVLLLGMGGSSLGPEVLAETFGQQEGFPELLVLDSTDPAQVAAFEARVDLSSTLVIVSSKSGSTLEPNILKAYFWDRMQAAVGAEQAGQRFVAVTDPGSKLEAEAKKDGFRAVFSGDATIGGRYSVLSPFGLVPAAAMGLDLQAFLDSAALAVRSCGAGTPPAHNPGVQLGVALGTAAKGGRDKLTIVASPGLHGVGAWLEQLVAESTGKDGHGIVPVDDETLGPPEVYGEDRLFAYLRLAPAADPAQDAALAALAAAGHPVVQLELHETGQLGQAFFLWEFAVAVAGAVIGINPFDQPDVEASKIETRKLTDAYAASGSLPEEAPFLEAEGIRLFTDARNAAELPKKGLDAVIAAHLHRASPGDYVALLAYVERNQAHIAMLDRMRTAIRDGRRVATCAEFGPRFLHSTGQAYKGGPASGVFLQITADDARDLAVPGQPYSFGVVEAAQARGDFDVLAERGRRALRVHLGADVAAGLARLAQAIEAGVK